MENVHCVTSLQFVQVCKLYAFAEGSATREISYVVSRKLLKVDRQMWQYHNEIQMYPFFVSQIDSAFEVGTQFFTHNVEDKKKYARGSDDNSGYVWLEKER